MKKQLTVFTVLFGLTLALLSAGSSIAADKKHVSSSGVVSNAPVESFRSSGSKGPWGLGVTTIAGTTTLLTPAVTGWLPFNEGLQGLQLSFGIPSTSPFTLTFGALYKSTLAGTRQTGFHVGGGLALGSTATGAGGNTFFINISGVGGVHYSPVEQIMVAFDFGPTVSIVNSAASFSIGGLSTLLGASVMYMFD